MKMKRYILTVLCFAGFAAAEFRGAPVSSGRALELASQVLAPSTRSGAAGLRVLWTGEAPSETPALYVIGRQEGGFVIVAGDDRVFPVLAISESGSFKVEDMPGNVRWWMERMEAYVRNVRIPEPQAEIAWSERTRSAVLPDAEITDRVERLTPEWDQGNNDQYYFGRNVFNAKCPKVGDDYTLVGCTATALAEVLTYESGLPDIKMPASAHGVVEAYSGYPDASFFPYNLGMTYDWSGLRTLTGIQSIKETLSAGNDALVSSLAQLMADIGIVIRARYGTNGTSANIDLAYLIEHFDINKKARIESQGAYPALQWIAMLKKEIDSRPVLYSGRSNNNPGHQFVFDGYGKYMGEDVFHVNFGWGGRCNGYYRHISLVPNNSYDFSYDCQAVLDFYPDADSVFEPSLRYESGLSTSDAISPGKKFVVSTGIIWNSASSSFKGKLRFVHEDKSGNQLKDVYIGSTTINVNGGVGFSFDAEIESLSFGDRIVGYCSAEGSELWKKIACAQNGSAIGDLPLIPVPFIETDDSYIVGDFFVFYIKNIADPFAGTVWTITGPDGVKNQFPHSEWGVPLSKVGKYKIEAAVAPRKGAAVTEHLVTYITVK